MASLAQFDKDIIEAYELLEAEDFRGCLIKCCENIDTPDWWLMLYVLLARCVRERWGDDEAYLYYAAGTTIAALEKDTRCIHLMCAWRTWTACEIAMSV